MDWADFISGWKKLAQARGFQIEVMLERDGLEILGCNRESANENAPWIYTSSGVHGDEPAGPQALMRLLEEDFFDDRANWLVCPVLNPTGLVAGTRTNKDGDDLNRDYKTKKTPEVQGHLKWLDQQPNAVLFLSLHEDWESTGFYYYEINLEVEGPSYEEFVAAAAPFFPPEPEPVIDDHETRKKGWIYHEDKPDVEDGWPEAIYLAKKNCTLSFTFEMPSSKGLEARIECHKALVKTAVEKLKPC